MKAWAIVEANAPLEEIELPTPVPKGSEVLIEVTHCGVCHSDLHFWKGEYDMGGGKVMKLSERGVTLPRAPGHEVAGRVVAQGPDATGMEPGRIYVVYPWLGCGHCEECAAGQDNMCSAQHSIGIIENGGFATHVLVPHPRYLVDIGAVEPALAATYACSGIAVYSAVRKVLPLGAKRPVVLIGAGGLGLTAIAMLKALGHETIISVDLDPLKRAAAMEAGATATIDGAGDALVDRIIEVAGGPVPAVIDFVNSSATAAAGLAALGKGGRLILVGVAGGEVTLSLAGMVFRSNAVVASLNGSPQDLREVMALANSGKLLPTPITTCPRRDANAALNALKSGNVIGRLVLATEQSE